MASESYLKYWKTRWLHNDIPWHHKGVDRLLLKHYEKVTGKSLPSKLAIPRNSQEFQANSKKAWFIPLCGKTEDIPFLLSLGYRVFGIECAEEAVRDLNQENNLNLEFDEERSLFSNGLDGRLEIYLGDFFHCPVEQFGPFDYVWDHGSLIAMEYSQREVYADVMKMACRTKNGAFHEFAYLLEGVRYDKSYGFTGPPRCLTSEDVESLFGEWTQVTFLEGVTLPSEDPVNAIGKVEEVVWLLKSKN